MQGLNKRLWQKNACTMPLLNSSQHWECLNFLVNLMFIRDLFIWSLWFWDQCLCLMDFSLASNPSPVLLSYKPDSSDMACTWLGLSKVLCSWDCPMCLTCSWPARAMSLCHVSVLFPVLEHHQISVSQSVASPGLIFRAFKPVFSTFHSYTETRNLWALLGEQR